ncbi:MAG: ABC transporter substrate-binding protein [Bacillota bacterium]|nr:ABC transporter substrate-binding protein [Bacillota bacterium]
MAAGYMPRSDLHLIRGYAMKRLSSVFTSALPIVVVLALFLAVACGPAATPTPTPTPTPTAVPTPTPTPTRVVAITPTATPTVSAAVGWFLRAPEPKPKKGGVLRTAWGTTPAHFDIHQGGGCSGCPMMYDGLILWNLADGYRTIIPGLAEDWQTSADQRAYTFTLRTGVRFHDGSSFSVDDVVTTFNRIINPPKGIATGAIRDTIEMVEKVEAVDAQTIRFTLKRPTPYFLDALAADTMVVLPKKTLELNNFDLRGAVVAPGTGPFVFKEHIPGEKVVLDRNPNYWNPNLPYVDRIEMLNVPAWADRGTAVLTGRADFSWNVSPATWQEGRKRPDMVTALMHCMNSVPVLLNNTRAPFDDPRVRLALRLAVDRQAIIDAYTSVWEPGQVTRWLPRPSPYATPVDQMLTLPGYRRDKTDDIATAKKLLAEAGYPDGFKMVITAWNTPAQSEVAMPALAAQLRKALNISATIRPVERARTPDILKAGDFEAFHENIYAAPGGILDPYPLWSTFLGTGGTQNWSRYSNADFDTLLAKLVVELDPIKRHQLAQQGLDILDQNPPFLEMGFCQHSPMANKAVKGLPFDILRYAKWDRFETVWLDK